MHLVAGDQLAQVRTQPVLRVGGNVVKLVHGDQTVIERDHPEFFHRKTESGMGTNQHLVAAFQKRSHCIDLTALVGAGGIAQVPTRLHMPVGPETVTCKWLIVEARTNGFFRHHNDSLLDVLVGQLVQGDEHQCPAFTGGRG